MTLETHDKPKLWRNIKVTGYNFMFYFFFCHIYQGKQLFNFLFTFLNSTALLKWCLLLQEVNSFLKLTSLTLLLSECKRVNKGRPNDNDRVASPEEYLFPLNLFFHKNLGRGISIKLPFCRKHYIMFFVKK